MIRFDEGNNRFNYRVVGVALRDNSVLLHQVEDDGFWTLPGGRAEFTETTQETLKREMKEEIDAEIEIVRLLWFVENFFEHIGKQYHEIALYFLMRIPPSHKIMVESGPFRGEEKGNELIFQWFPNTPETLLSLPVFPSFLATALQQLPESIQHIVQRG